MTALKLTIHATGVGTDSLTSKPDVDGLTVTFDDGTVKESFLSWKSLKQLCILKLPPGLPKPVPVAEKAIGAVLAK